MKKNIFIYFLLFSGYCFAQDIGNKTPKLDQSTIKQIVSSMTLEEKASLVVGTGMRNSNSDAPVIGDAGGKVPGAAGNTMSIERFGIHGTVLADGPAGVRLDPIRDGDSTKTYFATAWPIGTMLSSSWDTTLVQNVGKAFGNEVKEYGIDFILAPGANIQRDPLNGRNFEYYSEDPVVTGHIASAMINGIQSNGVGACIKHFVANNQESNRGSVDVVVSERALREVYLRGFEIAIRNSKPWTVMSAYNKINGTYASENYDLLTKILRDDWGYKGFVVTDWYAGKNEIAQMIAGNNLIEPGNKRDQEKIIDAVKAGMLDIEMLNKNVEEILNILIKTPANNGYIYSNKPNLKSHARLAKLAAAESMVLLKNDGTLPLKSDINIALLGTASYNTYIGGTGSGDVNERYSVSIADGLKNAGFLPLKTLGRRYFSHIKEDEEKYPKDRRPMLGTPHLVPELKLSKELIEQCASDADIAFFTIGRNSGEGADREIEGNFNLTDQEIEYIESISKAFHAKNKKLVVIINTGGVIETSSWKTKADAILLVWQPGQEAGNAVAEVINGSVNPSGKLPMTFPVTYEDGASAQNFPGVPIQRPKQVKYEEGIYVGYRYFSSFGIKPSYEFGFGLSYTQFEYSNLKLSSSTFKNKLTVEVTVKNTGKVPGKEVVQLYLKALQPKVDKPLIELKKFAKTVLLKPEERQTITFVLSSRDLASFDTQQTAWVTAAGKYEVMIGASSEDIKLVKSFNVKKSVVVEKVSKALSPVSEINELKK